ncbi:MAG TPA: AraC family transcriptional regulator, partial [Lachnospiraceae bacterium]
MKVFEIDISQPVTYHFTGKFKSDSSNWKHEAMPLDDYELFVVTEGTLYIQYQDYKYAVKEGFCLILPPGKSPNNLRKGYKTSTCSFYWMHFACSDSSCERIVDSSLRYQGSTLNRSKLSFSDCFALPNIEKTVILLKQLQDTVRAGYHQTILNYMATVVLCEIHQQFNQKLLQKIEDRRPNNQLYHDIVDYVNRNIHRSLTVSSIAAEFGYNEKYLSHMFGNKTGQTLKQYILQARISQANFLLT